MLIKFANYPEAVLVWKIMLFCSNYAKNHASTIRQGRADELQRAVKHFRSTSGTCGACQVSSALVGPNSFRAVVWLVDQRNGGPF